MAKQLATLSRNKELEWVSSENIGGRIYFRKDGIFVDGYQYAINSTVLGTPEDTAASNTIYGAINDALAKAQEAISKSCVKEVKAKTGETLISVNTAEEIVTIEASQALLEAIQKANTSVQEAYGDNYVNATVDNNQVQVSTNTQTVKDATDDNNGLAIAKDVKDYIAEKLADLGLSFATLEDIDALWDIQPEDPEEPEIWEEEEEVIDLSTGIFNSTNKTITWITDNIVITQTTGQGLNAVANYPNPIRLYDSHILKFESKFPAVYITNIELTKTTDGGGIIKSGYRLGSINNLDAVILSMRVNSTKKEHSWEITTEEGFNTPNLYVQYDGKVLEDPELYAVSQMRLSGIKVTYKYLV